MKKTRKIVLGAALLAVFSGAALALRREWNQDAQNRRILLALDWTEAKDWADRGQYPWPEFLERMKAIGINSLRIKSISAQDLLERGEAVFFRPEEVEKLRLLGIMAPGAVLKPMSLWVPNPFWAEKIAQAAQAKGLEAAPPRSGRNQPWQWQVPSASLLPLLDLGPNLEEWKQTQAKGLIPLFFLCDVSLDSPAWVHWNFSQIPENSWIFFPPRTQLAPEIHPALASLLTARRHGVLWMESTGPSKDLLQFLREWKGRVERGYEDETTGHPSAQKFLRAVRERSCRVLLLHFRESMALETNLAYFRQAAQALKKERRELSVFWPDGENLFRESAFSLWLRTLSAFLIVSLWPAAVFRGAVPLLHKLRNSPLRHLDGSARKILAAYGTIVLSSLLVGLFVHALLAVPEFQTRLYLFRGVKPALLLPWGFLLLLFYPQVKEKLGGIFTRPVTWRALAGIAFFGLLLSVLWLRSGTLHPQWIWTGELQVRDGLESWLGIRPRFKEILIGYPFLLTGIWLYLKEGRISLPYLLGAWAPVSMLNSFCHIHTPWWISLGRSLHGAWMGLAVGIFYLCIYWLAAITVSKTSETNSS